MLTYLDLQMGRWTQALAHASQTLDLARETGQPRLVAEALVVMADIEAAQGRNAASREHAREADRLAGELGIRRLQYLARRSQALLEFGQGRTEEAIARYEDIRQLATRWDIRLPNYSVVPDLIELYVSAGQRDRAAELLTQYLAMVPWDSPPTGAGRAARCCGILAAADEFDRHFQEAIAQHEQDEVAFQHARTRLCYGERLRRAQRRRDARVQLRAAAEIFDRLDARPWADRARAELRASGETISPAGRDTEQLTPQELQIALLVTEGKTNAEIGRAIFLSTRTVEFHLSRAYRKLGVSSRTELTRHLATAERPLAKRASRPREPPGADRSRPLLSEPPARSASCPAWPMQNYPFYAPPLTNAETPGIAPIGGSHARYLGPAATVRDASWGGYAPTGGAAASIRRRREHGGGALRAGMPATDARRVCRQALGLSRIRKGVSAARSR
jgi:DNA-binding CsgD family transcriptional regulator